ncbi:exopolyphosphatase [Thalassotalea euphylliae]|uniref:Ppx/GppA phosphatase family protein n=1 Tax=Thalassotalea euphylliae TaxID=1655234 RepID=UPI00363610DD
MSIEPTPEQPVNTYHIGALDIGSNSFHFVFARVVNDNLQILHSEKYRVRLAQGLDENDVLDNDAIERGLKALSDIAPLTENLSPINFRVVATYTLRQAKNAKAFIKAAENVFPFEIEVVSGHEEARLIYQGVGHYLPPETQRLVIDIGGGSTECVIGKNLKTKQLTSLNIGCVSFARQYFPSGDITTKAFDNAIIHAKQEIESHIKRFKKAGWQEALGTSGTMKALYNQLNQLRGEDKPFTLKELHRLKDKLINFGHADNIKLDNLKESRRPIIAPGLAIIIGIAEMLDIDSLGFCDYSLREGVLSEQFESITVKDIRDRTVQSLVTRFNADQNQIETVESVAMDLLNQVGVMWQLDKKVHKQLLGWAIALHEIGYDINPSAYHKHSNYIILNADMPGFNLEQHHALAWLVGNQRKKIQAGEELRNNQLSEEDLCRLLAIFRLAILLCQQRQLTAQAEVKLVANGDNLTLKFKDSWLDDKPLIAADLQQETKQLIPFNIKLAFQ